MKMRTQDQRKDLKKTTFRALSEEEVRYRRQHLDPILELPHCPKNNPNLRIETQPMYNAHTESAPAVTGTVCKLRFVRTVSMTRCCTTPCTVAKDQVISSTENEKLKNTVINLIFSIYIAIHLREHVKKCVA